MIHHNSQVFETTILQKAQSLAHQSAFLLHNYNIRKVKITEII